MLGDKSLLNVYGKGDFGALISIKILCLDNNCLVKFDKDKSYHS
jgi:hypothetical protein